MAVTEQDLEKQGEKVAKLREQIADANSQREERERELARELEMSKLKAEENQLQADLEEAKARAKVTAVKDGASVSAPVVPTAVPEKEGE